MPPSRLFARATAPAQASATARTRSPQVSCRIAALIVERASALGVDAQCLMASAGFDAAWLHDPEARMPLHVEERLWHQAAASCGMATFGLWAAQHIRAGEFDVLDYAIRTAATVGEALQRLARYNQLLHDIASFSISTTPQGTRITHHFAHTTLQPCAHAVEFTLASLVVVAAQLRGQPVSALAVEFAHAPLDAAAPYQALFGVVPRFRAPASCVLLPTSLLSAPVLAADATLSRIVTAHAEQLLASSASAPQSISAQVRQHLAAGMAHGLVSLRSIAAQLHLSERSLQRQLQEEGTRFADLMDEVRRNLAQRYIADPQLALGEVAYLLGFSEPSAFHRAFKRWTGTTPAQARRASR